MEFRGHVIYGKIFDLGQISEQQQEKIQAEIEHTVQVLCNEHDLECEFENLESTLSYYMNYTQKNPHLFFPCFEYNGVFIVGDIVTSYRYSEKFRQYLDEEYRLGYLTTFESLSELASKSTRQAVYQFLISPEIHEEIKKIVSQTQEAINNFDQINMRNTVIDTLLKYGTYQEFYYI